MLAPGDQIPSEASSSLIAPSSRPTSAPPSSAPSSTPGNHHHSLSGGAIAGIAVGGVAFLVICAALFFFIGRAKSLKEVIERQDATNKTHPGSPGPGDFSTPGTPGQMPHGFSPMQHPAEFARLSGQNLPPYGQHNATDPHPSGWSTPQMQQANMGVVPQPQTSEKSQHGAAELASPTQNAFAAELEAPIKAPR